MLKVKIQRRCNIFFKFSSQGYGLSLYGETTNGFFFSSDLTYRKDSKELTPEELARNCSLTFLQEIFNVIISSYFSVEQ
jgi:hypothetical protein